MHGDLSGWLTNGTLITILLVLLNANGRFRVMESRVNDLWQDFIAAKESKFSCPYTEEDGNGND